MDPIAVGTLIMMTCILVYLSSAQHLGYVAVRYSNDIGWFSTLLKFRVETSNAEIYVRKVSDG